MESAHGQVAVMLIEAGADRDRVGRFPVSLSDTLLYVYLQTNVDGETPEQLEGVGGQEQRRAKEYVRDSCGPPPS